MMRNLGGAIGTAAIETFFTKREQFHSFIINGHVCRSSNRRPATGSPICSNISCRTASPTPREALHRAVIAVGQTIGAQATIMGYADCFALLGVILIAAILPVAMLRKGAASGAAAH